MVDRTVKEASVEGVQRRTTPKKYFVFCLKVTWSDGTVNLVYRKYSEFLHLQTILCQAFPDLLGKPKSKHKKFTPLPATCMNIGETLFRRMEQVNYFLKEILAFEKVSQSKHIRSFLRPKAEDVLSKQQLPRKVRSRKISKGRGTISKTARGRFDKFRETKVVGKNISSPLVLEHYIVMEDYKKQAMSDINLKKGTTVYVIEKRECGWWLVEADGEVGWAPALFLEPADKMSDADISNVRKFPIGKGEVYVATKKYVAVEDDELTFEVGVNLQILEKNLDGWWKASYLGIEGWVPQVCLKELGDVKRSTRMCCKNQLRSAIEEEEVKETPEIETVDNRNKEDKKTSLSRKISRTVLSAMGKKAEPVKISEEGENGTDNSQTKKISMNESKTIRSMVKMGSVFLQLHKPDETSSNNSRRPRTPETHQNSQRVSEPVSKKTRPTVQRRAISNVVAPTFNLGSTIGTYQGSKDDLELDKSRMPSSKEIQNLSGGYNHAVESKWKPEIKNVSSSSLPSLREVPDLDEIETEDESLTQLNSESPNVSNGLSLSDRTPAIVIDELEDYSTGEGNRLALDDDSRSTESFEIEVNLRSSVESYSTDVYCTANSHEVDTEMYLAKGDYVKVIERASTGFWLVQNKEGVRGWTFSGHFYPVPGVNGNFDTTTPKKEQEQEEREDDEDEEDGHGAEEQDQEQYEEYEDDESGPSMFCQVIEDYEADEDNEEIDLHEGEIMQIVRTNESGWWCVQNSAGEIGWAPSNYLDVLEEDAEDIE